MSASGLPAFWQCWSPSSCSPNFVRRVTHNNVRAVVFAVLMPEAALYYGLLMAKVSPDTATIPFAVAMLWALVRLNENGNPRWWLPPGPFSGVGRPSRFPLGIVGPRR